MAYDAPFEWTHPRRWRRWVARLVALLALAACAAGVYAIVHEATKPEPPAPLSLQPEVRRVAASADALGTELAKLRPGRSRARAIAALREAKGDRDAASSALANRRAPDGIRDASLLSTALDAHRRYLSAVGSVLRDPRHSRLAAALRPRARRARAAWAALPDPAGLPKAIRGYRRLAALARAARG